MTVNEILLLFIEVKLLSGLRKRERETFNVTKALACRRYSYTCYGQREKMSDNRKLLLITVFYIFENLFLSCWFYL